MKATQTPHDLGQSLWLENFTRDLLNEITLKRHIGELATEGGNSEAVIRSYRKMTGVP